MAVLLFAGTALLLAIVLVVAILMVVTRRRRLGVRRDRGRKAAPIADAWEEAARRAEPFDRPPDDESD